MREPTQLSAPIQYGKDSSSLGRSGGTIPLHQEWVPTWHSWTSDGTCKHCNQRCGVVEPLSLLLGCLSVGYASDLTQHVAGIQQSGE